MCLSVKLLGLICPSIKSRGWNQKRKKERKKEKGREKGRKSRLTQMEINDRFTRIEIEIGDDDGSDQQIKG